MATVRIKKDSFVDQVYANKMMITKAGAVVSDEEKKQLLKQNPCLEEVKQTKTEKEQEKEALDELAEDAQTE